MTKHVTECDVCNGTGFEQRGVACTACCEHDFDMDEGYTCLNCGEQGDYGDLIDAAEYRFDPER